MYRDWLWAARAVPAAGPPRADGLLSIACNCPSVQSFVDLDGLEQGCVAKPSDHCRSAKVEDDERPADALFRRFVLPRARRLRSRAGLRCVDPAGLSKKLGQDQ